MKPSNLRKHCLHQYGKYKVFYPSCKKLEDSPLLAFHVVPNLHNSAPAADKGCTDKLLFPDSHIVFFVPRHHCLYMNSLNHILIRLKTEANRRDIARCVHSTNHLYWYIHRYHSIGCIFHFFSPLFEQAFVYIISNTRSLVKR